MKEIVILDSEIKYDPWEYNNLPKSYIKLSYLDNIGFKVEMTSYETNIRKVNTLPDSPVYQDSCLEAFINFYPNESDKYLNFEVNPNGTMLVEVGTSKFDRSFIRDLNILHPIVNSEITNEYWKISYIIPLSLIKNIYGKSIFKNKDIIKANFYKCGDLTDNIHFGSFNNIINKTPNFHLPEFFKEIELNI